MAVTQQKFLKGAVNQLFYCWLAYGPTDDKTMEAVENVFTQMDDIDKDIILKETFSVVDE